MKVRATIDILYKLCKFIIKSPAAISILSINLGKAEERGSSSSSSGPTQNHSNALLPHPNIANLNSTTLSTYCA